MRDRPGQVGLTSQGLENGFIDTGSKITGTTPGNVRVLAVKENRYSHNMGKILQTLNCIYSIVRYTEEQ